MKIQKKILIILALGICFSLSGCFLKPKVVDVQQGNIIDKTSISALKVGMSKDQVHDMLGTPAIIDMFDNNVWTYVYTKQINGGKIVEQNLTLYFSNNRLIKVSYK
jgi:outer membrane protein assembly factor BamE